MQLLNEQETALWLRERDHFLVLTHGRPDGDTLGCAVALSLALQGIGKTAYMAVNPEVTPRYAPFLRYAWAPAGYQPDFIVNVDVADEQLLPPALQCWRGKSDLCIDHHSSNQRYAKNLCLDAGSSACAESMYRICELLGVMNEQIACALYVALTTDNGCFRYSSTTPESHRIAAKLLEHGNFMKPVNKVFFQTKTRKELELQSMILSKVSYFEADQIVIGGVTLADKAKMGVTDEDCSELASFCSSIEGVKCAAIWREMTPNCFKLSVRCDESWVNASHVCAHFGGGGHAAAAGGRLNGTSLEEAEKLTLAAILEVRSGQ